MKKTYCILLIFISLSCKQKVDSYQLHTTENTKKTLNTNGTFKDPLFLADKTKSSCKSKTNNDLSRMGVNGKVRLIKIEHFQVADKLGEVVKMGKMSCDFCVDTIYLFNNSGFLIEEQEYYRNGKLKYREIKEYDLNCQLIELQRANDEIVLDIFKYRFEEDNLIQEIHFKRDSTLVSTKKYLYDSSKKLITINSYDEYDFLFEKSNLNYLQNNVIIEDKENIKYDFQEVITKSYDDYDNLLSEHSTSVDVILEYNQTQYDYNLDNKVISKRNINQGILVNGENYSYDVKGRLIKIISFDKNGQTQSVLEKKYNDREDLIQVITSSDKKSEIENYEYIYDSSDNWIKRVLFSRGIPRGMVERTIEYIK